MQPHRLQSGARVGLFAQPLVQLRKNFVPVAQPKHSPRLLLRMKREGWLPRLSDALGTRWSTNGDLLGVKAIDQTGILLGNGCRLERSKPLHIRQGYTITSQTSQGHERAKMFGFRSAILVAALAAMVAIAVALGLAQSASATPTTGQFQFDNTYVDDGASAACGRPRAGSDRELSGPHRQNR